MSALDPIAALRTTLLADHDVATITNERIFGGELPDSESKSQPRAAVVLKPAGGAGNPGGGYQQYGKTRVDVICFGETLNESWAVYLATYAALKGIRRVVSDGVLLHSADVSSKGVTARDAVKQWPITYSSWLVLAAES